MKIVLASTSKVKEEACKKAFAAIAGVEIICVKAPSGVNEQPVDDETLRGAFNRIAFARNAVPDADLYVSIENGIFNENGAFVDRAVVTIAKKGEEPVVFYSDGVAFPKACVEEARKRGFETTTVGRIMEEWGIVAKHDDPHADLARKSRIEFINQAMMRAVTGLRAGP